MNEKELDYDAWESIKRKKKKVKYEKKWTFISPMGSYYCCNDVTVTFEFFMLQNNLT